MKWSEYQNKFLNGPELNYYSGQRGLAGIGQSLVHLYNVTLNETYINVLKKIGNYFDKNAVSEGYSVKWVKSEDEYAFWTSVRYGNSGIIPFLIDLYDITSNQTYLTLSLRAGNWLLEKAIFNQSNAVYWRIQGEQGFVATDYYYGVAGVISSLLDLYSETHNKTFLDYSVMGN